MDFTAFEHFSKIINSKKLRSAFLYAETTLVDYGGLMEGNRLNEDDHEAFKELEAMGLLTHGRTPAVLIGIFIGRSITHWVDFTDIGWQISALVRREQCNRSRSQSTNYSMFLEERA